MKKIKLITSLGAISALGGGVAFTATSCSKKDDEKSEQLTEIKVYGEAVPTSMNLEKTDTIEPISIDNFSASYNGKEATLKTLTITSSDENVIKPTKVEGKEEYSFTTVGSGNATLTVTLEDENQHKGEQNIAVTVATEPVDTKVASIQIDKSSIVDVAVRYDKSTETELGQIIAIAYNKAGEALSDKKFNFQVKQSGLPTWLGTIQISNNGIITTGVPTEESTTVQEWSTTYTVSCEGITTSEHTLRFYFIPAYDKNGIIYDNNGTPTVANFTNDKLTMDDLNQLSGDDDSKKVTVGGVSVSRDKILSVGLYSLDSSVTSIPDNFCNGFKNLIYLDSSAKSMNQITKIGNYFLHKCRSLSAVNLLDFSGLTTKDSIGQSAFNCCDNLLTIELGIIPATAFKADSGSYYSFATDNSDAPCYSTGITLVGKYAQDIHKKFEDYKSWWNIAYRKTIAA